MENEELLSSHSDLNTTPTPVRSTSKAKTHSKHRDKARSKIQDPFPRGQHVKILRGPYQGLSGVIDGPGWEKRTCAVRIQKPGGAAGHSLIVLVSPEDLYAEQKQSEDASTEQRSTEQTSLSLARLPRFAAPQLTEWEIQKIARLKGQVGPYQLQLRQCPNDSIGNRLWPCSLLLSAYIVHMLGPQEIAGKRVLELGAGPGLVGICAHRLGAHTVITDLPDVMPLLEENVKENHVDNGSSCQALAFEWGTDASQLGPAFDIILASDVVYCEYAYDSLLQSLSDLAAINRSIVLYLAYKPRWAASDALFFDRLTELFVVEDIGTEWVHPSDRAFTSEMKLYRCRCALGSAAI
eukprot:TRINITY_DN10874_c0_g1_i1.p1 TRINITY_DN10874_c0_g1~~TRINITY_DN10874_c0_g1_i1.p1  ORF type:complete len:351 (+),score=72.37 TRINITY_DN10874_c0_g1_i1:44-1096(+)